MNDEPYSFGNIKAELAAEKEQDSPPLDELYPSINELITDGCTPTFVIENLVAQGRLYEIFGAYKSGKTLASIDMACSLATGRNFGSHRVKRSVVVYVAGEGLDDITGRLIAWRQANNINPGDDMPLYIRNRAGAFAADGHAARLAEDVTELAIRHPELPVVIFIDTLARNIGPDHEENGYGMSAFGNALLDDVVKPMNCAVLVIHHSGHTESTRSRGGSQWGAVVDDSLQVTKEDDVVTVAQSFSRSSNGDQSTSFTIATERLPGRDNFGNAITYPVLSHLEGYQAKAKTYRLSASVKLAFTTLLDAIDKKGIDATGHVPDGINSQVVTLESWRGVFYQSSTADSTGSKKKAFQRARSILQEMDALQVFDGNYVPTPGKSANTEFAEIYTEHANNRKAMNDNGFISDFNEPY